MVVSYVNKSFKNEKEKYMERGFKKDTQKKHNEQKKKR